MHPSKKMNKTIHCSLKLNLKWRRLESLEKGLKLYLVVAPFENLKKANKIVEVAIIFRKQPKKELNKSISLYLSIINETISYVLPGAHTLIVYVNIYFTCIFIVH